MFSIPLFCSVKMSEAEGGALLRGLPGNSVADSGCCQNDNDDRVDGGLVQCVGSIDPLQMPSLSSPGMLRSSGSPIGNSASPDGFQLRKGVRPLEQYPHHGDKFVEEVE